MSTINYSITITHYNSPALLFRMLLSIPERDDIQVIVVDDASTEENKEKISKLSHRNMELVFIPKNHGAGYARNVGLLNAKGKWLIACDCDDSFVEGAFEILDKYKDSDLDYLCYCVQCLDANSLHPNKRKLVSDQSVRAYIKKQNLKTCNLFKYLNTEPWNKMISLKFIRENQIQWENCRINVDVYFSFQVSMNANKFTAIPDVLYNFIGSPESITRKKRSIEREFGFYLAAQKRNGLFKNIGLGYPFYRYEFLYLPYLLLKRGIKDTILFYKYKHEHFDEVLKARKLYLSLIK